MMILPHLALRRQLDPVFAGAGACGRVEDSGADLMRVIMNGDADGMAGLAAAVRFIA